VPNEPTTRGPGTPEHVGPTGCAPVTPPSQPDLDAARCPLGVRCESCGIKRDDLAVTTVTLGTIGRACLTLCPACAASGVEPPITVATAQRLVAQHARHLGLDPDQTR
jgi:hypothetical protein